MLLIAEVVTAVVIGILVGRVKRALVIFTALYVLHAVPAALGWYGALSEWDDIPYWAAGFLLDAVFVMVGVGARHVAQRRQGRVG